MTEPNNVVENINRDDLNKLPGVLMLCHESCIQGTIFGCDPQILGRWKSKAY